MLSTTCKEGFCLSVSLQMRSWLPDCDPVVITYFCDLSINPTPTHLVSCLCYQIGVRYHSESSSEQSTAHMDNLNICSSELQERLSSLLASMPSAEQPLVLVLDGLAHMENNAGAQILESLPCPLPPSVKLVLTVSSNRKQVLQAINPPRSPPHAGEGSGYACVQLGPVDRRPCGKMLASLLSSSGRRVTSGQQALVNRALTSCPLTLYARLLHLHTSLWHSGTTQIFLENSFLELYTTNYDYFWPGDTLRPHKVVARIIDETLLHTKLVDICIYYI